MPELPSVTVYVERLRAFIRGRPLRAIRLVSPFLLRTHSPPLTTAHGRQVTGVQRIGKRIVIGLEGELSLVIHLMIAGRLRWNKPAAAVPGRNGLAAFDFDHGTLVFTEASKKKRASLHLVQGAAALAEFDRGGLEVLTATREEFAAALTRENHTLKRALTDPHILSGIGNAYSDEILHAARMSPFKQTHRLSPDEVSRLYEASKSTLTAWVERLRAEVGGGFPDKVTAFHEAMAVHGRYRKPCPTCGAPIQRIVYAENQSNYCSTCQTGGKLLADRALSRLLKSNWPRTVEELEDRRRG
jgi:formamidopyrimidine-DNA glycosylase